MNNYWILPTSNHRNVRILDQRLSLPPPSVLLHDWCFSAWMEEVCWMARWPWSPHTCVTGCSSALLPRCFYLRDFIIKHLPFKMVVHSFELLQAPLSSLNSTKRYVLNFSFVHVFGSQVTCKYLSMSNNKMTIHKYSIIFWKGSWNQWTTLGK